MKKIFLFTLIFLSAFAFCDDFDGHCDITEENAEEWEEAEEEIEAIIKASETTPQN